MTNITFSVDPKLHKQMKDHPEVRWSEICRRAIIEYLDNLENSHVITMETLQNHLNSHTNNKIKSFDIESMVLLAKKSRDLDRERLQG